MGEELFYVKNGLERYCSATGENADKPKKIDSLLGYHILPVTSDPTSVDGDGDGYLDAVLNDDILFRVVNPNGYIDVADPKPLYCNVKKYQLKNDYISVDGCNFGYASSYGGYQNAFYNEQRNKDNYDKIGKFIANNGCGLIAFSDMLLYLSNYNLYRSLTNINIESYSEGYIPFNEYQDYVRTNYLYFVENSLFKIPFPCNREYANLFNKYFEDKNVNLRAKTFSLNDKTLKQIIISIEKNIPVYLGMDRLTNPIVYNYIDIKYSNGIEKPYKICDGLKTDRNFKNHSVVITCVIIDSVQDKSFIEVSSWGGRYVIDMDNLLDEVRFSIASDIIIIS